MSEFDELVIQLGADPLVVGVVLRGSQARGTAGPDSDHDVLVVVADGAAETLAGLRRRDRHLDVQVMSLTEFTEHAGPGSATEWDRYSFRGARVLKDTRESLVADLVSAKATLTVAEADRAAPLVLDGFLNAVYRCVKSDRSGRRLAARLDGAEAVPGYLAYVFALHRRVRPYYSDLTWELDRYPLSEPIWAAERLLPLLEKVHSADVRAAAQQLLAELEPYARRAGHGAVLDAWGEDLVLMRGIDPARAS